MEFVALCDILEFVEQYQAHTKEDKEGNIIERESLEAHTKLCQKYFERIVNSKGLREIFERFRDLYFVNMNRDVKELFWKMLVNVIVFHDVGKMNPNFQREKLRNLQIPADSRFNAAGSRHSAISAILYIDYFRKHIQKLERKEDRKQLKCFLLYNSYIISRHHSGLLSFEEYLRHLASGNESYVIDIFAENSEGYQGDFKLNEDNMGSLCDVVENLMEAQSRQQSIWLYIYSKLLYSVLVACDYYATSEFNNGGEIQSVGNIENIQKFIDVYQQTNISKSIQSYRQTCYPQAADKLLHVEGINQLRSEMFLDAEQALLKNLEEYIFYLEAPTGGGKSNIAMNLSFQLLKEIEQLKKIYYVYPFNTLVEQNLQSLKKVFGYDEELFRDIAVVNSITPIKRVDDGRKEEEREESGGYYEKALLDRQFLNYPMVVTTHVSLFDTMFGDTKESAFGFHQLAGSVIVLDEIQSYKNKIWGEIISFLKEMASMLHMKIIIMSATLPNLHLLADNTEGMTTLIEHREKYFEHPCFANRVKANYELLQEEYNEERLYGHIKQNCIGTKKVLVEFIKKATAYAFYQRLVQDAEIEAIVLYMSGEDSIIERSKMLHVIKKEKGKPIILIATQVIEAGVDIDMDVGYKNVSMFDSEEQFIGRINRSFLNGNNGKAFFFKADEPKRIYGEDVRLNREFMLEAPEMQKIFVRKAFPQYYKEILKVIQTNYNCINTEQGLDGFFREQVGVLNYGEVKNRMKLIEESNWSMSVYLGRVLTDEDGTVIDGRKLWMEYREMLQDTSMEYAEKKVKLSDITSKMNFFIYQIKKNASLAYTEQIGDIFYIEDGEKYFDNGKLNREKIQGELGEFVDFI